MKNSETGDWRKLNNEMLHSFYSSLNIIWVNKSKRMRHVACKKDMRNVYKISVGKLEGKRPLGRYRHR
jgi:hypothetical protein